MTSIIADRARGNNLPEPDGHGARARLRHPARAVAAFRRGTRLDRAVVTFGVFGISSPAFVTGILLLYVFGVLLHWFPIFGAGRRLPRPAWHMTLPAVALALSVMAIVVKITRAAIIQELDRDYVIFARARGLSRRASHSPMCCSNALIPVVTAAGLIVVGTGGERHLCRGDLRLAGARRSPVEAVQKRDIPLIQGTTLVFSVFVVLVNLAIDVVYTLIDPRIRFGKVQSMSMPDATAARRERRGCHGACPIVVLLCLADRRGGDGLRRLRRCSSRPIRLIPSGSESATSRPRPVTSPARIFSAAMCSRA